MTTGSCRGGFPHPPATAWSGARFVDAVAPNDGRAGGMYAAPTHNGKSPCRGEIRGLEHPGVTPRSGAGTRQRAPTTTPPPGTGAVPGGRCGWCTGVAGGCGNPPLRGNHPTPFLRAGGADNHRAHGAQPLRAGVQIGAPALAAARCAARTPLCVGAGYIRPAIRCGAGVDAVEDVCMTTGSCRGGFPHPPAAARCRAGVDVEEDVCMTTSSCRGGFPPPPAILRPGARYVYAVAPNDVRAGGMYAAPTHNGACRVPAGAARTSHRRTRRGPRRLVRVLYGCCGRVWEPAPTGNGPHTHPAPY